MAKKDKTAAPKGGKAPQVAREAKISDELRQAVMDLGGDDEDLALIEGVDDDEVDEMPKSAQDKGKGKVSEKDLRKALGSFMKGLDFSVAPGGGKAGIDEASSEEESISEGESGGEDEDEAESDEEDESDEEEVEEEGEEEESEDDSADESESEQEEKPVVTAKQQATPKVANKFEVPKPTAEAVDPNLTSGTNVPPNPMWSTLLPPLPPTAQHLYPPPVAKLNTLRQRATHLLETLPAISRGSSSSDQAFISQILQSGTHQDKLSALILLVRESPIHSVKELSRLRAMAGWKEDGTVGSGAAGGNKDQRVAVMKAVGDWWVNGGGKLEGKLRYFADQPLLAHPQVSDRHLVVWGFEDWLKRWFFNVLQVLEVLTHDPLPYIRTQSLQLIFQLLSGNAEQEQNLLRLGVNKLGDADRSVASKASYLLLQLLQAHPAMKAIVAREVSALVLKPSSNGAAGTGGNGSHMRFDDDHRGGKGKKDKDSADKSKGETSHARYYGLITLNQIMLSRKDGDVAARLVELYFEVFREVLGEGEKREPGVKGEEGGEEVELEAEKVEEVAGKVEKWRGRRKGAKPRNGRKSALEKEEGEVDGGEAKLVAAVLTGINRALPYATLDEEVFDTFLSTLFRVTHTSTFNTSIQALSLIFQVAQARLSSASSASSSTTTMTTSGSAIADRFYRTLYDSLFDPRLLTSSKQAMYLNLLFKSLKADRSVARVMAFVKRLCQLLGMMQPPFVCGALYLLGELFNTTPGLKRMLIEPEDDGEEHFRDADALPANPTPAKAQSKPDPSVPTYDGRKRDPLYAHAETSCLWDILPLTQHYHPSVSLQASQLLLSQPLTGSPDIGLNTLVSFLDRFVYRNPKKQLQPKGASVMQPAAAGDKSGMVVMNKGARTGLAAGRGGGEGGMMLNEERFGRLKEGEVRADELFFHKFFAKKLEKGRKGKGKKEESEDEDEEAAQDVEMSEGDEDEDAGSDEVEDEEVDSDPEEAEIWKAMKATMPAVGDDMGLSEDESGDVDEISVSEGDEDDEDEEDGEEDAEEDEDEDDSDEEEGEDEDDSDEEDVSEGKPLSVPGIAIKKGKAKAASPAAPSDSDNDSDDDFPAFGDEDEDDLIPIDEMPDVVLGGSDEEQEEEDEMEGRKRKRKEERKERKKKRKEMPVFGSYEDYREMIEAAGSEED